jgi:hypothetical protein
MRVGILGSGLMGTDAAELRYAPAPNAGGRGASQVGNVREPVRRHASCLR